MVHHHSRDHNDTDVISGDKSFCNFCLTNVATTGLGKHFVVLKKQKSIGELIYITGKCLSELNQKLCPYHNCIYYILNRRTDVSIFIYLY